MFPEICHLGPFTIYAYGLMLVLAFFVGAYLACAQAKREKVNPDKIFNLLFGIFIWGIVGCRVFYVLNNLKFYLSDPLEIIMLQHGGMSWFGGLIFGSFAACWMIKRAKLNLLETLDLLAPFVALGQAIGRIGCLLNGCCYGKVSRWGLYFPSQDQVLIPTQLYSSLLLLLIFYILRTLQERKHLAGQIFYSYLFLYALKRFGIEFLRNDTPKLIFSLSLFQLLSIPVFIFAGLMLMKIHYAKK